MKRLPEKWIERIFQRLSGIYGAQFRSKFSQIENGFDVGIASAAVAWAEELGNFYDNPEAISYALQNLPTDHCPNAIGFTELCRKAPKKSQPILTYTPTPEDEAKARAVISQAAEDLKPKFEGGIDRHWATHPRSEMHLRFIFDAANNDARFKPCVSEMIEQGIITAEGKLKRKYSANSWVKA